MAPGLPLVTTPYNSAVAPTDPVRSICTHAPVAALEDTQHCDVSSILGFAQLPPIGTLPYEDEKDQCPESYSGLYSDEGELAYPATHTQSLIRVLPAWSVVWLGKQAVQLSEPLIALYVPTAHTSQASPIFPMYPTGHVPAHDTPESAANTDAERKAVGKLQLAIDMLPTLEKLLVGQFWQVLAEV